MNTFLRFKMLKNGENMGNGKISRSGARVYHIQGHQVEVHMISLNLRCAT